MESASILYTTDTVDWVCDNYNWIEIPAELDTSDQTVTARIPNEAQYYFVNGISNNGTLFSSSMRKAEPDPKFAAYPEFSWDHVPLYMHMRKSTAFNQEELEYLAGFPILTLKKPPEPTRMDLQRKELWKRQEASKPSIRIQKYSTTGTPC